jgi:hypothetical protein
VEKHAKASISPYSRKRLKKICDNKISIHRGHLFAAQYRPGRDTFVFTNAFPQFGTVNSRCWNQHEKALKLWARQNCQNSPIYIIVGVILSTYGCNDPRSLSNDWVQHAMVSAQSMLYYVICIQRLSGTCYSFSLYVILCGLYPTTEHMRYGFSTVYVILCCLHPTTGPNVPWFQYIWLYYVICIKRLSAMWYGFSTVYVILCRLYSTTERNVLWFQSKCYTMLFVSYNWPQRAMVSAQSICCTIGRLYPTEASEQSIRYIMLSVSNDREVHPPNLFGGCCHHQSLIQVCCGTWMVIPLASRWLAVQDTIIQNL